MMKNKQLHILSTKILDEELVQSINGFVQLDCRSFIEIQAIPPAEIAEQISGIPFRDVLVVFTSMNAVNAVAAAIPAQPVGKVACIEAATRKKVEQAFPESTIVATAPTGAQLAERIIEIAPKKVLFFCGNKRLDTIPAELKKNGVPYKEITVYRTIKTPQPVSQEYDGIVFYSPSGVESFFELNTISEAVTAYSIGPSTTKALQRHTENIMQSNEPDMKQLVSGIIDNKKYLKQVKI